MDITIKVDGNEVITLYMLIMDRVKECDKNLKASMFYGDMEGAEYWTKEKTVAIQLQNRLDGVI